MEVSAVAWLISAAPGSKSYQKPICGDYEKHQDTKTPSVKLVIMSRVEWVALVRISGRRARCFATTSANRMRTPVLLKMSQTPEIHVEMDKRKDGAVILKCIRRDGSATWQRHEKHAAFFSFHDLTHFAVETTIGFRAGFYGLIADGWDIEDTTGKGKRGKLSAESVLVEHVVGLLDRERAGGSPALSAAEFNAQLDEMAGKDAKRRLLTESELENVRNRIQELHQRWAAVPAGSALELTFSR